ncbi:MAG: family 20 glycosylhydrolase [Bacteroidales bacterium]|nr:family 20 glycosylhydrolase [Bacteroidales bacterium]
MKQLCMLLVAAVTVAPHALSQNLLPKPKSVTWQHGTFSRYKACAVEAANATVGKLAAEAGLPDVTAEGDSTWTEAGVRRLRYLALDASAGEEAYTLRVAPDTIEIAASSTAGFRNAKATLRQLEVKRGVACCTISDAPALGWRGAMLDVSRHFFPIEFVKKQVDIMARFKMNRLHLHLTDAAGWRMEIKRYPRLTQLGAWRTEASWKKWWAGNRQYAEEGTEGAYGGYYTQEQLRDLVAYAAERGITIVPEIEMPAHSEEVLTAYPEFSCTHEPYKQADFCPGNEATFTFLENVLREVMDIFPSKDIHIGGDEAGKASWPTCPLCQKRVADEGLADSNALQGYLVRRIGKFLREEGGRTLIGWDEVLADSLQNATVMIWRDTSYIRQAFAQGLDVVLAPGRFCYIDGFQDDPPSQPEAMGGFQPLSNVYSYQPLAGFSAEERKHIRGIQGNLWTEYVPTTEHVEQMLYPRLLAIAENGWTGGEVKDYDDFRARALLAVEELRDEGVNAFDLKHEVGDRAESRTPVEHLGRGAKVTYNLPFNERYCADGVTSLTDGRRGGWDYGPRSAWQGFIRGQRFDVTLDLGKTQELSRIVTNFYQSSGPEIFLPAEYIISVSTDGEHFTTIHSRSQAVEKLTNPSVEQWEWKGTTEARYVRVQAKPGQYGGWIFVDEVEIY